MSIKTITLTYKLIPETTGYLVECLDWEAVYTQGENINECMKHATEATELMLQEYVNGTLHKSQYPHIKSHKASFDTFQLAFDLSTGRKISIERTKTSKAFRVYTDSKRLENAF